VAARPDNEPLLQAHGVGRRYGADVALESTNLAVRAGETRALVGPNGAGKSTLLAILAGALEPTAGTVSRSTASLRVGWVPQRPAQYGRLTARENLELFARLEGVPDVRGSVDRLLALVALEAPDRAAASLSVGVQQRLNIAIALLADPDVLLLDEPTAALDPGQRRRLWSVVETVRERGGGVVFATQNLDEVDAHADTVGVLAEGRLVFDGLAADYARAPEAKVFG
jgi:ABC-2 type transport system ATP-binding protein